MLPLGNLRQRLGVKTPTAIDEHALELMRKVRTIMRKASQKARARKERKSATRKRKKDADASPRRHRRKSD